MLGVIANTLAIFLGGGLGLLLKKGIPERVSHAVMMALALCTIYMGIDGALVGENTIVLIVAMVLGTIVGTAVDLDGKINRLGEKVAGRFKGNVTEGFMTASLLFCIGAMAIVGAMDAGLRGDNRVYFTKSVLDLFGACMLASTLGVGVMLSGVSVFVVQGLLVLLAGLLQNALTDSAMVAELVCCGNVIIIGLGLNLLGVTKLKIANFLPAILFAPLFYLLFQLLPI